MAKYANGLAEAKSTEERFMEKKLPYSVEGIIFPMSMHQEFSYIKGNDRKYVAPLQEIEGFLVDYRDNFDSVHLIIKKEI